MQRALCVVLLLAREAAADEPAAITVGGYLETYYQLHLQDPDDRITNLRGFDNRSRTFTLSNVALDVKGERGRIGARLLLQVGHTPSTYYLAEPVSPGTGSVDASSGELWKYVQQATLTGRLPGAWTIDAGLFPSPIGPEVLAIKDNMNWSRSNLFFGLPFYHTGITVSHPLADGWTAKLHAYNGWNSVVDNNGYPSVAASVAYSAGTTIAQVLYFGGIERATGAPEGTPWRHLVDALAQVAVTDEVTIAAQLDAGIEPNDLGRSAWLAGALYGKLALSSELYAAVRADAFYERVPDGATPIFWPVRWVASGTATLAYQPVDQLSLRLEYRHDQAAGDVFVDSERDHQDTITLGATAWF